MGILTTRTVETVDVVTLDDPAVAGLIEVCGDDGEVDPSRSGACIAGRIAPLDEVLLVEGETPDVFALRAISGASMVAIYSRPGPTQVIDLIVRGVASIRLAGGAVITDPIEIGKALDAAPGIAQTILHLGQSIVRISEGAVERRPFRAARPPDA